MNNKRREIEKKYVEEVITNVATNFVNNHLLPSALNAFNRIERAIVHAYTDALQTDPERKHLFDPRAIVLTDKELSTIAKAKRKAKRQRRSVLNMTYDDWSSFPGTTPFDVRRIMIFMASIAAEIEFEFKQKENQSQAFIDKMADIGERRMATRILRAIFREHYDANKNEDPEACVKLLVQQRDELRARVAILEQEAARKGPR